MRFLGSSTRSCSSSSIAPGMPFSLPPTNSRSRLRVCRFSGTRCELQPGSRVFVNDCLIVAIPYFNLLGAQCYSRKRR